MFDNNPFSGALSSFFNAAAAIADFVGDRLADLANFLGLPNAPATSAILQPFVPPFTGGQCTGGPYRLEVSWTDNRGEVFAVFGNDNSSGQTTPVDPVLISSQGAIVIGKINSVTSFLRVGTSSAWRMTINGVFVNFIPNGIPSNPVIRRVRPVGFVDNCGDLPNPNPAFPPSANAFNGGNADDGTDGEIIYAGLPVLSAAAFIAALRLVAEAIQAAADALDGIRKIGEALKGIIDLLKEILDGKKERDKENPKNRKYSVGAWRAMPTIDGLIPTTAISLDGKIALPYKVQIVIRQFPSSASRILGTLSPSISIDSLPLFYLLLQEDDFGISAVKTIRTLNSSTSIPPFHRGVFWNFRLNPQMEGKYRLFYQTEPEEEELVPE
jgi:hypothetical protein